MEGVWSQTFCTLILGGWKGGLWSPELLGGPKLVGGTSSLYHVWFDLISSFYVALCLQQFGSSYVQLFLNWHEFYSFGLASCQGLISSILQLGFPFVQEL